MGYVFSKVQTIKAASLAEAVRAPAPAMTEQQIHLPAMSTGG